MNTECIEETVSISKALREVAPHLRLGILTAEVKVSESCDSLRGGIDNAVEALDLDMEDVAKMPQISEARRVYRTLGKDPTRYRLSSDSLYRRIIKGKGLYYVNNIVDLNNLLSLSCGHSIGTYDRDCLQGRIVYSIGTGDDLYEGIGRGVLNIDGLPVLRDEIGCFGSATSDSVRSMVTGETRRILMNVIAFDGDSSLEDILRRAAEYLKEYASGTDIRTAIIE